MLPIDVNQYNEVAIIKQKVARDLIGLQGVIGVSVGHKRVGGIETTDMAILVYVRKKGFFNETDRIPLRIEGVKTDVIEGEFHLVGSPSSHSSDHQLPSTSVGIPPTRPLLGGCSVGRPKPKGKPEFPTGTLGCVVYDTSTNDIGFLSNYHVLCVNSDWNSPGSNKTIIQPGYVDGGVDPTDAIGEVCKGDLYAAFENGFLQYYADCAICNIYPNINWKASILNIGGLSGTVPPMLNAIVRKCGRTTALTRGQVTSIQFDLTVDVGGGPKWFTSQIAVSREKPTDPVFSDVGDSGAILVDPTNHAMGLVFAKFTASDGTVLGICNPIQKVLKALGVGLVTVG